MNNRDTLLKRAKELEDAVALEEKRILLGKNKHHSLGKTLLRKAKEIEHKNITDTEKGINTLFHRYMVAEEKGKNNKENLSMLEKGLMEGNEFVKLHQRKKRDKPAVVNEKVETDFETIIPYDDKHDRLLHYAEKYRIPYARAGVKKTLKELAHDIHKYEMKNIKQIMKLGLDKKFKEYGHYISLL